MDMLTKHLLPKEFQITCCRNQVLELIYNASLFYNLDLILID